MAGPGSHLRPPISRIASRLLREWPNINLICSLGPGLLEIKGSNWHHGCFVFTPTRHHPWLQPIMDESRSQLDDEHLWIRSTSAGEWGRPEASQWATLLFNPVAESRLVAERGATYQVTPWPAGFLLHSPSLDFGNTSDVSFNFIPATLALIPELRSPYNHPKIRGIVIYPEWISLLLMLLAEIINQEVLLSGCMNALRSHRTPNLRLSWEPHDTDPMTTTLSMAKLSRSKIPFFTV